MSNIIDRLIESLDKSTCNFLAVSHIADMLEEAGYQELDLAEAWKIEKGGKYYVTKNSSAIFAFIVGDGPVSAKGLKIISAHSDSPGFKLKPNCEIYGDGGMVSLNVEKYGGPIMYTWFDRPLSISGRVMLRGWDAMEPEEVLVDFRRPIATIPHLAIHFNRAVNEGNPLSVQRDMLPVVGYYGKEEYEEIKKRGGLVKVLLAEELGCDPDEILDYELSLYPVGRPILTGTREQFIQSGRIDDLSMAFAAIEALIGDDIDADDEEADIEVNLQFDEKPMLADEMMVREEDLYTPTRIVAIFDNEETGSGTKQGAASPVLRQIVERIAYAMGGTQEDVLRQLAKSFMISADDAHAWHPNYNSKYDPTNHPVMGGGPVVKINANCKYMTDARGAAIFHGLCEEAGVEMQYFVNHSDVAGGSTLGNISSSQMDIDGVDVGCAIWAMHSAVETASVSDHIDMVKVFKTFFAV